MESIEIFVSDYLETIQKVSSKSVKLVFIDPPYNVLPHEIEKGFSLENIPKFVAEIDRIMQDDSFFAFFGQMPTILDWCLEARKIYKFKDHISWIKRNITAPYLEIQRSHEELMIYYKGKPRYVETEERYEDLKTPALWLGAYEYSTMKTTLADLQRRLFDRKYDELYFSGLPTENSAANSNDRLYVEKYKMKIDSRKEMPILIASEKDLFTHLDTENSSNSSKSSFKYRSKWYCNLTNTWYFAPEVWAVESEQLANTVWSYLAENQISFGESGNNHKHPTVKSLLLVKRAISLMTNENDLVFDCFLGSGTTALACKELNRRFVGGDISDKYIEITNLRLKNSIKTLNLF